MASTGKLRSLWWEFKRRTFSRNIKAAGLTISRSLWWDREGWEHVRKVWIFSVKSDFVNVRHYDLDDVYSETKRLHDAYTQISAHLKDLNLMGLDIKLQLETHPRFFYVGAESDEWLVHYRLMFSELSVFDDNLSQVDIRV